MADHLSQSQSAPATKMSQTSVSPTTEPKFSRFFGWKLWATVVMVSFGATGYVATATLLSLNSAKGCESVFWPLASGARRLYCAQVEAKVGDADSLLAAINLVSQLPDDHPLRAEIDKSIKIWSEEILVLGEKQFQEGNIQAAMETADKIPASVAAKSVIDEKVKRWEGIWEQKESIDATVEEKLYETAWNLAFREAGKLVDLDNEYLANRYYTELVAKIQQAKTEGAVLDEARIAFDRGGTQNLLTAIEKAESIERESYSYPQAQQLITQVGEALMSQAKTQLDRRNWRTVLDLAQAIPPRLDLEEEVSDLRLIALAGLQAQLGSVEGLKEAVSQAQRLNEERPLYEEAQNLISRWENEIEDIKILTIAQQYARGGRKPDLQAAMAKVEEVPRGNPRYQEAQSLRMQWNQRVQIMEDQPILNRAEVIARGRDIDAYRGAIAVASQISSNRVLSGEARRKIAIWQDQIERIEDEPILSQATRFANQGRLEVAIETAKKIGRNRALYGEAQGKIQSWRSEINARESIRQAYELAENSNPDTLLQAIRVASRARSSSTYRFQAERLINQWSKEIYSIALRRADESNFPVAISIAQQIPSQSSIYQEVRGKIQQWKEELISNAED